MAADTSMSTAYTTNMTLNAAISSIPKRATITAGATAPNVPASRAARSPMPASAKRSVRCSAVVVSGKRRLLQRLHRASRPAARDGEAPHEERDERQ